MAKKFDPTDRDIIRVLSEVKMRATPAKVAKAVNVHPATAKRRMSALKERKILDCKSRGNRMFCKVNEKWKKKNL